jgi:hypothetical protein
MMANLRVPRLRRALSRVNAGPDGSNRVVWTSLREVCIYEDSVYATLNLPNIRNLSSTLLGAPMFFVWSIAH